jgi:hypothetical protein
MAASFAPGAVIFVKLIVGRGFARRDLSLVARAACGGIRFTPSDSLVREPGPGRT